MNDSRKHHFKGRWVYLVVFAMIMQLMSGVGISAETTGDMLLGGMKVEFSKISIKETAESDEELGSSQQPIITGTTKFISYDLKLSNCKELSTEQAIQVTLPNEFKLIHDEEIPLSIQYNGENKQVGICKFTAADGVGNITFNEVLKTYKDAKIGFAVGVKVEFSLKPGEEQSKKVEFKVGTQTIGQDLEFKGDNPTEEEVTPPKISKTHTKFDEATGNICWVVTVKAGNKGLKDAVIQDSFKTDELILKSIQKDNTDYTDYTSNEDKGKITIKINVPELEPNQECAFYITTEINSQVYAKEDAWKQIKNTASLTDQQGNKLIEEDKTDNVSFTVNWIKKSATPEQIIDKGINVKVIKWTVVVNGNKRDISGYKFTDYLPQGTELIEDSVKLNGTAINKLDAGTYAYDNSKEGSLNYKNKQGEDKTLDYKGVLQYTFKDNLETTENHKTYTFAYTTKVTGSMTEIQNKGEYCNYAAFEGAGTGTEEGINKYYDYKGIGIQVTDIEKSASAYNPSQHKITWTIVVNRQNNESTQIQVSDQIPEGLILDEESIKVAGTTIGKTETDLLNSDKVDTDMTAQYSYSDGKLTCIIKQKANEKFNKAYEIKFDTFVEDKAIYANNLAEAVTYKNQATAVYTRPDGKEDSITSQEVPVKVTSTVIKKQAGDYNYSTGEATWLIVVNQNKMPMENVTVTDIISAGQEYQTDSFKVLKGAYSYDSSTHKYSNNQGNLDKIPSVFTNQPEVTKLAEGERVTYSFPSIINTTYTIVLKTKVNAGMLFKPGQKATISNVATIISPSIYENVAPSEAANELSNSFILKSGKQLIKDGPIEWQIIINPNKAYITDAVITDTLCEGLKLDTESVKLYMLNIAADGKINTSDKQSVSNNLYNITYDKTTNTCSFAFVNAINDCYLLIFNTVATGVKPQKDYTNTASLKGATLESWKTDSEKVEVKTQFSSSWGSVTEETGTIKLHKVDEETKVPLKDAEFTLSDGKISLTAKTDEKGIATFDELSLGKEYILTESKAPSGYAQLTGNLETIKLTDSNIKEITVKNTLIKNGLQFKKVDIDNKPLEGATFTLTSNKEDKKTWTSVSNKEGLVNFTQIPIGRYLLKEVTAPTGYVYSEAVYEVEIKAEGPASITLKNDSTLEQVTQIENEKIKGSIKVIKVGESNNPLQGAEISLLSSNKDVITKATTDAEGAVYFNEVPYGIYYIKESKAPSGYILDETLKEAVITSQQQITVTLTNKKDTPKDDDKKDDNDKKDHETTHSVPVHVIDNHKKDDQEEQNKPTDNTVPQTTGDNIGLGEDNKPHTNTDINMDDYGTPVITPNAVITPDNANINYTSSEEALPKTGQGADAGLMALIGGLFAAVGSGISLYRRRKVNK